VPLFWARIAFRWFSPCSRREPARWSLGSPRVDLPGLLVLPLGLAGTIVLVQPFTASDATAELGVAVAAAAAAAGRVVSRPWRRPRALGSCWSGGSAAPPPAPCCA
jgi:hypothetical protein